MYRPRTLTARGNPKPRWIPLATPENSKDTQNYEFYHFNKMVGTSDSAEQRFGQRFSSVMLIFFFLQVRLSPLLE